MIDFLDGCVFVESLVSLGSLRHGRKWNHIKQPVVYSDYMVELGRAEWMCFDVCCGSLCFLLLPDVKK